MGASLLHDLIMYKIKSGKLYKPLRKGRKSKHGVCCHYPGEKTPRFIEPFILLLLHQRAAHGYEILRRLRDIGLEYESEDIGYVYRNLRRLESRGFVKSSWDVDDRPGPRRRTYSITKEGIKRLEEWAESISYIRENLGVFLKLYEKTVKGD